MNISRFLSGCRSNDLIWLLIVGLYGRCINPEIWTEFENTHRHLRVRLIFLGAVDRVSHMRWHPLPLELLVSIHTFSRLSISKNFSDIGEVFTKMANTRSLLTGGRPLLIGGSRKPKVQCRGMTLG